MRPNPDETFESWANRVEMFEKGRALQELARGRDIEIVIEEMSRRIVDKMMSPVFKAIRESSKIDFDMAKSRAHYETLIKSKGLSSDHVDTDT
jgi:glutamyl-tRNA reductase